MFSIKTMKHLYAGFQLALRTAMDDPPRVDTGHMHYTHMYNVNIKTFELTKISKSADLLNVNPQII